MIYILFKISVDDKMKIKWHQKGFSSKIFKYILDIVNTPKAGHLSKMVEGSTILAMN